MNQKYKGFCVKNRIFKIDIKTLRAKVSRNYRSNIEFINALWL
jgi:hypothetical protein